MNYSYAKIVNGELAYAPDSVILPGGAVVVNPKRLSYLQAGYKPLALTPPADDPPSGTEWTISRYVETADAITAIYKPTPIYAPPRTFSKLKLVAVLSSLNLWSAFRDWLVETDHYDLFVARPLAVTSLRSCARPSVCAAPLRNKFLRRISQSFREDHPSFTAILYAAQERFCLSDHEIEDILSKCVADD